MGIFDLFAQTIGVEPGSHTLKILRDGELIFNELSQISFNKENNIVTGIGNSCVEGKNNVLLKPINYTIEDFHAFEMLLRGALKKNSKSKVFHPTYIVYFTIPSNTSEVEKRAYRDSGEHAGAKEVYMIHQSCSAAIGMNILFEKKDFILIDFGASKFEVTVFANSKPVAQGLIKFGTNKIFRIIKNYIFRKHKASLSLNEIENELRSIKINSEIVTIKGIKLNQQEFQETINNCFNLIEDEFLETIEIVSNHLNINKILSNGIYLTGGGIKLDFLFNQFRFDDRIPIHKSASPSVDSINGLKLILEDKEKYRNYLIT